jgi:hypothetical protein
MRNSRNKLHPMMARVVWATLVVCACLIVGGVLAFAQETTVPDKTYGEGGSKTTTITKVEPTTLTTIKITDGKGIRREYYQTSVVDKTGKKQVETTTLFDCKGEMTYKKEVEYDIFGNETYFGEERYKDGKLVSGFKRETDANGKKTSQKYDSKTGKYEDIALEAGPTSSEISTPPRDTSTCTACKANEIVGEFQFIREDAQPDRFNTYGLTTDYTRFLNSSCSVGVTGDFNIDFRTGNGADLTKTSFLGGITFIPFKGAKTTDKVTISTHALFGVSHFSSTAGSVSSTDNSFTMKLGGAVDINVTNRFFIRAQYRLTMPRRSSALLHRTTCSSALA